MLNANDERCARTPASDRTTGGRRRIDRRSVLRALVVAGSAGIAGCLGDDGDDGAPEHGDATDGDSTDGAAGDGTTDETADGATEDGAVDGDDAADGPATDDDGDEDDDGTAPAGAGTTVFDFATTGRYEYELDGRDREGWLVWDVEEIDGDEATVRLEYELSSGAAESGRFTTTPETVNEDVRSVPHAGFVASALFTEPTLVDLDVTDLTVGDEWSESIYEFEVVGTDERAGLECTVVEAALGGGSETYAWCISPEHAMVVGATTPAAVRWGPWEFTLVEYTDA